MNSAQLIVQEINGCVIIPTYNNERTLMRVIHGVLEYIPANRILIVNDGSTDRTSELLSQLPPKLPVSGMSKIQEKERHLKKGLKKP